VVGVAREWPTPGGTSGKAASSAALAPDGEAEPLVLFGAAATDDPEESAVVDAGWLSARASPDEAPTICNAGTTARTAVDAVAGDTNATTSSAVSSVAGMRRSFFIRAPPSR
jgi:hypothetical protein